MPIVGTLQLLVLWLYHAQRGYCRVDCKKKCRQFVVEAGGELTLKNIMIARGVAPVAESAGGAILVKAQGTVTATVVIFRFNGARGSVSMRTAPPLCLP